MKSRSILYGLIALIILVILIWIIRPNNSNKNQTPSNSPVTKEYSFVIKDKKLLSGADTIKVTDGDKVKLTLSSDSDYPELHLHGYEIAKAIKKDTITTLEFTANKTGSYALEVHMSEGADNGASDTGDGDLEISHLEVQPK